jgi:hypothetical protein
MNATRTSPDTAEVIVWAPELSDDEERHRAKKVEQKFAHDENKYRDRSDRDYGLSFGPQAQKTVRFSPVNRLAGIEPSAAR